MRNLSILEKSILATIAYYDVLDFALTPFEIYKYLVNLSRFDQKYTLEYVSLHDILKTLETSDALKEKIDQRNGLYFFKGRDELVEKRIAMRKINDAKWKRARKIVWWLQLVPHIRMVLGNGSLAVGNTDEESDLDVLIVVRSGRIWTTRFLVTSLTHIMGVRRYGNRVKDRICLNHYVSDSVFTIPFESLYNAETYAHLIPILVRDRSRLSSASENLYQKFQNKNEWLKKYLVNYHREEGVNANLLTSSPILGAIYILCEAILDMPFGNILEKLLRSYQTHRIFLNPGTEKSGGRVVADDTMLAFHPDSPERAIIDKYNRIMVQCNIPDVAREIDSGLQ